MAETAIIGRDLEVRRLTEAIDEAVRGNGSVWYLNGEAGIGKSRLAEEVARLARDRGMRAFWGRCWEAGGAPAYWPWVQVLRAVLRTSEPDRVKAHQKELAQILPELRDAQPAPDLDAEQARFRLMDAVSTTLTEAAQQSPVLLVLEDLHAADVSTVLLLELLTTSVRNHPLMVVGTFREAELASAPAGAQLLRAAQQGTRASLARLDEDDVESFLKASGETPEQSFVHALHETTDGHPLFLVEVARLWKAQGGVRTGEKPAIPRSVRTAIQERLEIVSPACRNTLRRGAVVGREFDIGLLAACYDDDIADYVPSAQEATDAAILVETAPQRYRFVHFLIREQVYGAIPEAKRMDAHARLAAILQTRPREGELRWAEVAHHLVAAGRCREASSAFREAGRQALAQLAFEEAAQAYQEGLRAAEKAGDIDPATRAELLIELGHAQTRAGRIAAGKATCAEAAASARKEGDAELLAQAALEHGTALLYARVDLELVSLLREALDALGPSDSSLRARVMARLAAALQPADDPEGPMELARDAIAMARRLSDPSTLLDTLRNGGSAMVDLGDVKERLALDREHAALAEALDNPVEALRGNLRAIMDYLALERLDDAYRAIRTCERIAEDLDHAAYAWRPVAMQSLRALWEGRLDDAEHLIERVGSLGQQGADPNAQVVYLMQKVRLLQLRGDFDAQLPLLEAMRRGWKDIEIGRLTANTTVGAEHATAGRIDLAERCFDADATRRLLRLGDHTLQLSIARLCVACCDRELAEMLHRRLLVTRDQLVTGGILYMTLEGPTSWGLAWLAAFLGRNDEASEHFEHALEVCKRTEGLPVQALVSFDYARHLANIGDSSSAARVRELARNAEEIAAELAMDGLRNAVSDAFSNRAGEAPSVPASPQETLSMTQVGDSWLVSYGNVEFHLKDVRGVRLLARLVGEPGRELHVLEMTDVPHDAAVDRGDAGEALDDEARRQYRARVMALREELEEAESWNDPGRAERAREELSFIERELSKAVGLGGRDRRSGSAAERARVNVQRRIRDAIRRIDSYHPGLAKHLDRAVRTGTYCVYEP